MKGLLKELLGEIDRRLDPRWKKRLTSPQLWLAYFSMLAVVSVAIVDTREPSPGDLTRVHARQPEIDRRGSCSACHGGVTTTMASACLDCHSEIEEQVAQGTGLHGIVEDVDVQRCALCHGEHHGEDFAIVNRRSFVLAGVEVVEEFDHGPLGYSMEGRHTELSCTECHAYAATAVLPEGAKRYLGLSQDCSSCHDDPHGGAMGVGCVQCHDQRDFTEIHTVDHDRFLPLTGSHGGLDCRACHEAGTEHALERITHHLGEFAPRACADCHGSPHGTEFAAANARAFGHSAAEGCVVCHELDHSTFRHHELQLTPEQHAHSGFSLAEPHEDLECAACHGRQDQRYAERYPGRAQNDCQACHGDPHGGQFEEGSFAGQGCLACHASTHFEPHLFGLELHAQAGLPLEGAHTDVACEVCHGQARAEAPRAFTGTDARCDACHGDAHRGFFDDLWAEAPEVAHGDCARCHEPEGFDTLDRLDFAHGQWTGFELRGAHAQNQCESCHVPQEEPDELGRTFGWAHHNYLSGEHSIGVLEGCASCHEDPHEGRFDLPGLPSSVEDREGCARCHGEASFRSLAHGFDHDLWTGYTLGEAHADLGCAACHEPLRRPDAIGRTWGRAAGTGCVDCHVDPHGAQFEVEGTVDCARCHTNQGTWAATVFDHQKHSRFALDENHAELDCSACHKPGEGASSIVRYRPLGMECVDCHGVHEDVMRRRRRRVR